MERRKFIKTLCLMAAACVVAPKTLFAKKNTGKLISDDYLTDDDIWYIPDNSEKFEFIGVRAGPVRTYPRHNNEDWAKPGLHFLPREVELKWDKRKFWYGRVL